MNTKEYNYPFDEVDNVMDIMSAAHYIDRHGAVDFLKELKSLYPEAYAKLIIGVGSMASLATKGILLNGDK